MNGETDSPAENEAGSSQPFLPSTFVNYQKKLPPDILYHYTTGSGLLGIVENHSLWATKIQYMNDTSELSHALNMMRTRLSVELSKEELEAETLSELTKPKQKIRILLNYIGAIQTINVCVTCLCTDGDTLSQWRGYSAGSYAYSLGFKSAHLKENANRAGFVLGKVIYDYQLQKKIIEELAQYYLKDERDGLSIREEFGESLQQCGALFKSDKFKEEDEWRLISSLRVYNLKFRLGKSMLIPYAVFDIGDGTKSSIDHVYVGPNPHPDLSKGAVVGLLMRQRIGKGAFGTYSVVQPDVRDSTIPFRDW
jgi:Protein of unknown function (DUF2971)